MIFHVLVRKSELLATGRSEPVARYLMDVESPIQAILDGTARFTLSNPDKNLNDYSVEAFDT
jgi:hypothetical protein